MDAGKVLDADPATFMDAGKVLDAEPASLVCDRREHPHGCRKGFRRGTGDPHGDPDRVLVAEPATFMDAGRGLYAGDKSEILSRNWRVLSTPSGRTPGASTRRTGLGP